VGNNFLIKKQKKGATENNEKSYLFIKPSSLSVRKNTPLELEGLLPKIGLVIIFPHAF